MKKFTTNEENLWRNDFGDNYIERNKNQLIISSNIALFSKIFNSTCNVDSVLEIGSNIGLNLEAIKALKQDCKITAIEINENACKILKEKNLKNTTVINDSIIDYTPENKFDFVFTKGVLIHLSPDFLEDVYRKMYECSNKYIVMAEYYNPSPVEVKYRGLDGALRKRDFCGDIMELYPDLQLIDYGFVYKRDNNFELDDITWFVLEKK